MSILHSWVKVLLLQGLMALSLAPTFSHASEDERSQGRDRVRLAGRHAVAVKVGFLSLSATRNAFSSAGMSSQTSADVLGELSYSHWLAEDWSLGLSAGALVLDTGTGSSAVAALPVTATQAPGVFTFRSAAVTAVLLNLAYQPARLAIARSLRPYVSLAAGPYVGTGERVGVGTEAAVESVSEAVLGVRALAGLDMHLGRRFKVGLSGGYRWVGDFDEPIGSYREYSGPELSLELGVLLGRGR